METKKSERWKPPMETLERLFPIQSTIDRGIPGRDAVPRRECNIFS